MTCGFPLNPLSLSLGSFPLAILIQSLCALLVFSFFQLVKELCYWRVQINVCFCIWFYFLNLPLVCIFQYRPVFRWSQDYCSFFQWSICSNALVQFNNIHVHFVQMKHIFSQWQSCPIGKALFSSQSAKSFKSTGGLILKSHFSTAKLLWELKTALMFSNEGLL